MQWIKNLTKLPDHMEIEVRRTWFRLSCSLKLSTFQLNEKTQTDDAIETAIVPN